MTFGRGQRAIARLLLFSFLAMSSFPAGNARAQQWEDANNTTFGDDVSLQNSGDGLQTEFTIESDQTTIGWQDLQQPQDNTLTFTFTNPTDQSTVLNYIGAQHPSQLNGRVECPSCTVAFSNPYGIYIGGEAVLDVGNLALIAGEVDRIDFLSDGLLDAGLDGIVSSDGQILADGNVVLLGREVINNGTIRLEDGALLMLAGEQVAGLDLDSLTNVLLGDGSNLLADLASGLVENNGVIAAPDAALVASRVANHGEIEIAEGTLLMVAADAIQFRRFDDPVSIHVPRLDASGESAGDDPAYAIENDGRIDAGLGHVRLSASDPLGFGIRQGTGGSIAAKRIEIEGGEAGRVELGGTLDASDDAAQGTGGEIDVTGSFIVLTDAALDASGTLGGGTIHVGGEQQGSGDLQRARAVLMDQASTIRADALDDGDGGRVIVFSEGLTSIDGEISATGGAEGGGGGFVETSGLARFAISRTPDVSAAQGRAGAWLIDPYDICISSNDMGCGATEPIPNSLDDAINAILSPDFDDSVFDGIIRTLGTSVVDPAVIAKALGVGTDVTLSTQAFTETSEPSGNGDITLEESIQILNADTIAGTVATLTLLAAGNITIDGDILSGTTGEDSNLALSVALRANDPSQNNVNEPFSFDLVRGDVVINGNIETGGGDLTAQGIAIHQDVASTILTLGGDVSLTSGTLDAVGNPVSLSSSGDPDIASDDMPPMATFIPDPDNPTTYAPVALTIDGIIDTRNGNEEGGDITLSTASVNVNVGAEYDVVTAELTVADTASLVSGGGDILIQGGAEPGTTGVGFAANVRIEGTLDSCRSAGCTGDEVGGTITIDATHIDPTGGVNANVTFVEADAIPRGEGGLITIDVGPNGIRTGGGTLSIGSAETARISIDGELSTTGTSDLDEQGLISIVALDQLAADSDADSFGDARISIGTQGATTLSSAGLTIQGRSVTTSDAIGANPVVFDVRNSSSAELEDVVSGQLRIVGNKNLDFGVDTSLSAEVVVLEAATRPIELTSSERVAGEAAISFRGGNGAGETGVQIGATTVSITTGDGTTTSSNLFSEELLDELGEPTDFAVSRGAYGTYDGLQLQSFASATDRPDAIEIAQDASFTISNAITVGDGELNLVRAFDGAAIGANGMRIELESSDGVLTIADATALNDDPLAVPGSDAGKSWVTLLGGLLLPTAPDPVPSPESVPTPNSVVFGSDGGATPLATPFDVEALVVSSPGDMSVDEQVALSIGSVNELTFVAGRNTGVDGAAGRGTLTIGDAAASVVLQAGQSLSVLAGASGFGDLVFEATPTETLSLRANEFLLRAGAGSSSLNTDGADLSAILGLASSDIDLRDAAGNAFGSNASPANVAFRYQQDAAIDAASDLPSLDQFGLLAADGFRDTRDVVYSVRSDAGAIDLDDDVVGTNEGDRFKDAALSLIGTSVAFAEALDLSDEFSFEGDSIEIGATGDFRYTEELANAFNRSNTNPNAVMTIRSGVGSTGDLSFDANTDVVAARINLIAGDGIGGGTGSSVDARNVSFDMSGANPDSKIFVYQQDDANFTGALLPTIDQFVGGISGAPDILAIRSDSGILAFTNFDATTVPVDTTGTISRLVLEADTIRFTQNDANNPNLDLESPNGLKLRLRANDLELTANDGDATEDGGKVLLGSTAPIMSAGNDADFDNATLLIEAFDLESKEATVENLSSLSADADGTFDFDLADGRGPTSIAINQNGSVDVDDLPDSGSVSGELARVLNDDEDGDPIATNYSIISSFGPVAVRPDKVENSNLVLIGASGSTAMASDSAFAFESGDYSLSGLSVSTEDSIVISENTTFTVDNLLSLAAGLAVNPETFLTDPLGSIRFELLGATPSIDLTANQISLTAGTQSNITQPDGPDEDLDRDPVINAFLPRIDFDGIRQIRRSGDADGSSFRMEQNASLDLTTDLDMNGTPDLVEALTGGPQWEQTQLTSVQQQLDISSIDNWVDITENLTLAAGFDGSIVADIDDQARQFGAFAGNVVLSSNDVTIKTDDAAIQLDLASPNVEFRSTATEADRRLPDDSERSKIRDDPDALERPIVRFRQVSDFSDTLSSLPTRDQYTLTESVLNFDLSVSTSTEPRENLNTLDIELQVTGVGATLTLDDPIRESVFGSNLILKSAGDVAIDLTGAAPGYDDIDAAALSLSSLDIRSNFLRPGVGNVFFTIAGFPTVEQTDPTTGFDPLPAMIGTTGDQRFDGNLALQTSMTGQGRDITITGDVIAAPGAGLELLTSGKVNFQGDIGTGSLPGFDSPLDHLKVLFEILFTTTPTVEFGAREDLDGDGILESPILSNQIVRVENDIIFETENATDETPGRRLLIPQFGTIAKALGDLTFFLVGSGVPGEISEFIMGTGEKLSVGGTAQITTVGGDVRLGDVSAIDLVVTANNIALARRATGTYFDTTGETQGDAGPTIAANTIRFEDGFGAEVSPVLVGDGKDTVFGVPNPFDPASYPSFLNQFSLFEIRPGGSPLTTADFRFEAEGPEFAVQVPVLPPIGSSRSDLSRAFGPKHTPAPTREIPEPLEISNPERLGELGVEPRIASSEVQVARLTGAAIIDDSGLDTDIDFVSVTQSRLDAQDVEEAIALYEELFGPDGDRATDVRSVLQSALDRYLEETRSRRVIGFELRRFVKNRPSTLIEAYETLESLDELFRYHRRLGLSPGEYRKIQREWLREIQPDGITLDELSETIHPSRYVRGSDILDIFGQ